VAGESLRDHFLSPLAQGLWDGSILNAVGDGLGGRPPAGPRSSAHVAATIAALTVLICLVATASSRPNLDRLTRLLKLVIVVAVALNGLTF